MRVINEAGENVGVLATKKALAEAQEKGLDLIEISPNAHPPVARMISFDKFRYQEEKKEKKQRKTEKTKELKQVRISPRAALNDLQIKARLAEEFINEGHKVEIQLYLRGREKVHKDWNRKKMNEFLQLITIPFRLSMEPKPGGRGMIAQIDKK